LIAAAGHFWESLISSLAPRLLLRADGQLFTADGAAARDDSATVGGLHAGPKTVRFGAATVIRLESSFGHCVSWMSFV
jgi:hypothetical protein